MKLIDQIEDLRQQMLVEAESERALVADLAAHLEETDHALIRQVDRMIALHGERRQQVVDLFALLFRRLGHLPPPADITPRPPPLPCECSDDRWDHAFLPPIREAAE